MLLASSAWEAFRAPTPHGGGAIVASRSPELRFLGEAFDRLSREYPSSRDGLSLTERRVLAAVAAHPRSAGSAFVHATGREVRPFLADTWCFAMIDRLARARVPLVEVAGSTATVGREIRLRLTGAGAKVLAAEDDHVALNGIDRWIGGVHLVGPNSPWRWDEGVESLVEAGSAES